MLTPRTDANRIKDTSEIHRDLHPMCLPGAEFPEQRIHYSLDRYLHDNIAYDTIPVQNEKAPTGLIATIGEWPSCGDSLARVVYTRARLSSNRQAAFDFGSSHTYNHSACRPERNVLCRNRRLTWKNLIIPSNGFI